MSQSTGGIPEKYAKLKQAEGAGLAVPNSLLLDFGRATEGFSNAVQTAVVHFSGLHPNSRFIVRSAHLSEDADDYSLAGHFWSSGPVTAAALPETIQQAQRENAAVLASLKSSTHQQKPPSLVLQEYIEHDIGGVLFAPWSFFPDYAYVEYSETGVKQVVEGDESLSAVLCLDKHYGHPLSPAERHQPLMLQLVELCRQLRTLYDFPVDCEWAYESYTQRVVVLQVRPQTHSVGPLLPCAALQDASDESNRQRWQFTALSESLGRLSPLSFSLLQQLYTDTIPLFRCLGCRAKRADLMCLAPDGTVLVDVELETQFYALTLFGGFQRGLQQAKLALAVGAYLKQYDSNAPFSYEVLKSLFAYWMAANLLSAGAGRSGSELFEFTEPAHAYELSWPASLEPVVVSADIKADDFAEINAWGRSLFLFELNKLKLQLKQLNQGDNNSGQAENDPPDSNSAYLYFSSWQALEENEVTSASKRRQHELAPLALYDYALCSSTSGGKVQVLSSTKWVEGPLQIVANPASSTTSIEANSILVAPYFDSRWISQLKLMKGVVVSKGSRLSHSAIVAREYHVPYYVVPDLDFKKLDQGQEVTLDPNAVTRLFT